MGLFGLSLPKKVDNVFGGIGRQVNPFDNGLTYKNQTPTGNASVGQQIGNMASGVVRAPVQFANTIGAGEHAAMGLAGVGAQSIFGSDKSYQDSLDKLRARMQVELGPNSGILHQGTLFKNAQEAQNITPQQLAGKSIATGSQLSSLFIPEVKGAGIVGRVAGNAATGALGSAAGQYLDNGKVSVGQVGKDAATAGALGEVIPVAKNVVHVGATAAKNAKPLNDSGSAEIGSPIIPTGGIGKKITAKTPVVELSQKDIADLKKSGYDDKAIAQMQGGHGETIVQTPTVEPGKVKATAKKPTVPLPDASYGGEPGRPLPLQSKENALRSIGTDSAVSAADKMVAADRDKANLRGSYMSAVPTLGALKNGAEMENFWGVIRDGEKPLSPNVAKAAKEWQKLSPVVRENGLKEKIGIGNQKNYLPTEYDPKVFKKGTAQNKAAVDTLVNAGEAKDIQEAQSILSQRRQNAISNNVFGHFEKSKGGNLPGEIHTKEVLYNYLNGASERTAQARHFGPSNEVGRQLTANIVKEGGDGATAAKAMQNYLHDPSTGLKDPVGKAARGGFALLRESKAAISHIPQIANVSGSTTFRDLGKGVGKLIAHSDEDMKFIRDADTTNPIDIHGLRAQESGVSGRASKFITPGLSTVLGKYRGVATLAGRDNAIKLAARGTETDINRLKALGVEGKIGKTLTRDQQIQAARGIVNEDFFDKSRRTTPINAETRSGKLAGQARMFAYKETGYLAKRLGGEARKGNIAPALRFGATSLPLLTAGVMAKNQITGNKEGPGGVALDVAAAAGGLPSELAIQGVRYGRHNFPKEVASTIAPVAGEATDITQRIQTAFGGGGKPGNLKPLEGYGAGLAPLVGGRLSKAVNPYTPPAGTNVKVTNGVVDPNASIADKNALATKQKQDMASGSSEGYDLQGLPNGKFAVKVNGQIHEEDSLKKAQAAIAEDAFSKSNDKVKTVGDTVYLKDPSNKNGFTTQSKGEYQWNQVDSQTKLDLERAKTRNDINGWMSLAQKEYNALEEKKKLYDPTSQADKLADIQLQQDNLQNTAEKYQSYGGFTKGASGGGSAKDRQPIDVASYLKKIPTNAHFSAGGTVAAPKVSVRGRSTGGSSRVTVRKSKV